MLKALDKSPHIWTTDSSNAPVEIPSSQGKYTLVLFLRHSGCPWCHLTVQLIDNYKKRFKEKSCRVLSFVQSSNKTIQDTAHLSRFTGSSVTFIADLEMKHYKEFGVRTSKRAIVSILTSIPYWLKSVFVYKNKPVSTEGSKFSLSPSAFLIDNESDMVVYAAYDAKMYTNQSIEDILQLMK